MTDEASINASASNKLGGFFGRLHPMTRFLVIVAIIQLGATLVQQIAATLERPMAGGVTAVQAAGIVAAVAYSLTYLGGAASVEFLFRIWDELKRARTGD